MSSSLKDKIYQEILLRILSNEFSLDIFLVEKKLCSLFEVSRSPVREALVELCQDGILKNIPRAGYQIVRISEKQMRDAFQMRLILESQGLELAFERLNDKNIESLKTIEIESNRVLLEVGDLSLMQRMSLNDNFHIGLCNITGNALLCSYISQAMMILRRGIAQFVTEESQWPQYVDWHHHHLIEALEDRNKELALKYLMEDISTIKQKIREVLM
jgi:DNA-binding GntR family transcriptional regulator